MREERGSRGRDKERERGRERVCVCSRNLCRLSRHDDRRVVPGRAEQGESLPLMKWPPPSLSPRQYIDYIHVRPSPPSPLIISILPPSLSLFTRSPSLFHSYLSLSLLPLSPPPTCLSPSYLSLFYLSLSIPPPSLPLTHLSPSYLSLHVSKAVPQVTKGDIP